VLIVGEELDLCDSAGVLLKVRNEFTRADLPNANFTLHTTRADKLAALSQADRSDTTLVCVVNLPQELTIVGSIGPDFSIRPSTEDDFIREDGAKWVDTACTWSVLCRRSNATSSDGVGVGVPESNSAILAARDELIRNTWHEPNAQDWLRMVLTQEHL
jgi:hypothetical protein